MANDKSSVKRKSQTSKAAPTTAAPATHGSRAAPSQGDAPMESAKQRTAPRANAMIEHRPSPTSAQTDNVTGQEGVDPALVAREAYFIWLERGGNEVVNWIEAERRICARRGAAE